MMRETFARQRQLAAPDGGEFTDGSGAPGVGNAGPCFSSFAPGIEFDGQDLA
ncbi:MAG: hypothetical protein JXA89_21575 [Anaerolineae bacterium]|nr:hypothetical protein [Anaerolineae bacterium]